jgi:tetratricopeptide (TPR) repeat protein
MTSPAASIRFRDVTAPAGLHFRHETGASSGKKWYPETMGSGAGFLDYDGDGWSDILLVNGRQWPGERQAPEPTMQLYRNQQDGTFREVTAESGLNVPMYGMGMAAADIDNDGDTDLVVTGYLQTRLFRNEGSGVFADITSQSGLLQDTWSTAAAFVDVDRDGLLDLLIGQYVRWDPSREEGIDCTYGTSDKDYCAVTFFAGQGLRLYRNLGSGRFRDVTTAAGVAAPDARVLGLSIIDDNQDGWPDILVAADLTPSLFLLNQGDGTFREIGVQSGLVLDEGGMAFAGMGIDAAYLNNDDQLCVAIGNFAGQPTTLHCQVRVGASYRADLFTEQSHRAGLARPTLRMVTFGLFFFDADLDGWQDLWMVNGHVANEQRLRNVPYAQRPQLFRNQGNGTFAEVEGTAQTGLDLQLIGRGAAYADYDRDGDLDLLLTANQGAVYLLRNETPRRGHFVRVVTQGVKSNRDGIGAHAHLYTDQRRLTAMVRTGSSYLSQSELTLTFGLQAAEPIDRLEVLWPSGGIDVFRNVQPDTTFVAREGTASAKQTIARQTPPVSETADVMALKRMAMAHVQAGRAAEAVTALEQFLQTTPDDYIAQQYLVELYWRQGAHEQARTLLTTMSQAFPDANFLTQFAFHLEANALPDLAREVYQTAVRVDPQAPEAWYRLGKHALEANQHETALTHFQQALQRQPGLTAAQQGVGLVYVAQGKMAQAEAQFQAIIQQTPEFVEAYMHLGALYTRSGRLQEALQAYRTVVRLQPGQAPGHHNLGTVLAAQGATDDAIKQFREALRLDPAFVAAHNDLGTLYAERGNFDQAISAFTAAVQSDPTSVEAQYNLALAYGAQGDAERMTQALHETLKLDPQHVEANLNLGIGYLQQGEAAAASAQFNAVIRLAPHMANAHYFLAVAAAQLGQEDTMLTALQRTLQQDPNHVRAHSTLASLYFQRQQHDLAWQHATKAAQLGAPIQPLLDAIRQARENR